MNIRKAKIFDANEILAAGITINEGVVLVKGYVVLLDMHIDLVLTLDSLDLLDSLSTSKTSLDLSIRADRNVIRYDLETGKVNNN